MTMFEEYPDEKHVADEQRNEDTDLYEVDYEREISNRQNSFLDSYSAYLSCKDAFHKNVVLRKAKELELVDPTFDFHID